MGTLAGVAYWPADTSEPVLELTTGDLLREAAADAGPQTALIEAAPPGAPSLTGAEHTGRRWTYRQLLAEAEQCARWLLTRFSPGERITIWAPNIPEWIILQYGAALAGLTVVTANPALRAAELRYVLQQSRSAGLFHTAAFRGSDMTAIARAAATGLPDLRAISCFTDWQATVGAHHGGGPLPGVKPGDAAQIQYTSGTTGFPKGALLHHRGLVTNARFMIGRTQLPYRGTMVTAMPLFHTAGCAMGVLDDRGYLQVTGRIKDMIIRGGENIYATEIERVLFSHPGVRDVAVLGLPDPTWGEIVAAVLIPADPGQPPAVTELHDLCRTSLAPHKTPARWFGATELPLTGSGKIQKFRLREQIDGGELSELPPR